MDANQLRGLARAASGTASRTVPIGLFPIIRFPFTIAVAVAQFAARQL